MNLATLPGANLPFSLLGRSMIVTPSLAIKLILMGIVLSRDSTVHIALNSLASLVAVVFTLKSSIFGKTAASTLTCQMAAKMTIVSINCLFIRIVFAISAPT